MTAQPHDERTAELLAEAEHTELVIRTAAYLKRRHDDRFGVSFERTALILGVTETWARELVKNGRLQRAQVGVTRESLEAEVTRRGIRLLDTAA